jgi:hypothetical protein
MCCQAPTSASDKLVPWSGFDPINAFNSWKKTDAAGRTFAVDTDGVIEIRVTGLAWRTEVCQQVFEEAAVDCGRALAAWADSRVGKRSGRRVGFPRFKQKNTRWTVVGEPKCRSCRIALGSPSPCQAVERPRWLGRCRSRIVGGMVAVADRWYPSSQICSLCQARNNKLTLADRVFTCPAGHRLVRDLNAATNLASWGEERHRVDADTQSRVREPEARAPVRKARRRKGSGRHTACW